MSDSSFLSDLEGDNKERDKPLTEEELNKLTRRQRMAVLAKTQQEPADALEFTGLPTFQKTKQRHAKTDAEQALADENKRKQLDAILHEQHKKIMDRQEKLKREDAGGPG